MSGNTDRWLDQLAQEASGVADESDRGAFVLSVASAVANLKSDNVVDLIRLLLEKDLWRNFTYPNGDHYDFRECEFDYFLALNEIDPTLIRQAVRTTGAGDLEALLAEASMDKVGPSRRSVEDISSDYPRITPWLDKYGLRTLARGKVYSDSGIRENVRNGLPDPQKPNRRVRFQVDAGGDTKDEVAEKIVRRLMKDPELAKKVYGKIRYGIHQD